MVKRNYLVTGGAGFIGSNYVSRLLKRGEKVTIYDNLSRSGSLLNLKWLQDTYGADSFSLIKKDIRDKDGILEAARNADVIMHLAAQVAVTTSVVDPREDFEINALGTFNMLEAARASQRKPIILYTSSNKVYGGMETVRIKETENDYKYVDFPMGISEEQPVDFHSPYGCSKGCGDQYIRDYARIYDLPTVVFRQSCIYGTHQFGMEDQGWIAWFIIAIVTGKPISIYGDGKQVRDVLFIEDLMNAYDAAIENIKITSGQVFNIGGGPENTLSVWAQFEPLLQKLVGHPIHVKHGDWRPGDQRIYVSDIRKAQRDFGWKPQITVEEGVGRLYQWVIQNNNLFV